jgi:hypothetical protein
MNDFLKMVRSSPVAYVAFHKIMQEGLSEVQAAMNQGFAMKQGHCTATPQKDSELKDSDSQDSVEGDLSMVDDNLTGDKPQSEGRYIPYYSPTGKGKRR